MGNQITWQAPTADSQWDATEVHRSTSESGTYTLIATQDLPDTSYYDCDGETGSWYKIRFTATTGSCIESDYSDPIQGVSKVIYADPTGVFQAGGITEANLPDTMTVNTIYNYLYDISREIDEMNETIYGRIEAFEEYLTSSKYLDANRKLKLPYRPVSDLVVEFRTSLTDATFITLNEFFDYEYTKKNGRIHLYRYPIIAMRTVNDIRINGNYGQLTIPNAIKEIAELMASIKMLVHITGGTYNDVTSWSLGEYSESLGEPYVNLRETIRINEKEIDRIKQRTGITNKKVNMRLA